MVRGGQGMRLAGASSTQTFESITLAFFGASCIMRNAERSRVRVAVGNRLTECHSARLAVTSQIGCQMIVSNDLLYDTKLHRRLLCVLFLL